MDGIRWVQKNSRGINSPIPGRWQETPYSARVTESEVGGGCFADRGYRVQTRVSEIFLKKIKNRAESSRTQFALHSLPANALYTGFIDRDNAVDTPTFAD